MITAKILGDCVRPLLFEHEAFHDTPYQIGGSCFVCSFRDEIYIVTANHCLIGKKPDQLRVQYHPTSDLFLPVKLLTTIREDGKKPFLNHLDVAVFQVCKDTLDRSQLKAETVLDLDPLMQQPLPIVPEAHLFLRGYPHELKNEIDFDVKKIIRQAYFAEATYAGQYTEPKCHQFRFLDVHPITSINGMSGCPVFQIINAPNGLKNLYSFAGMTIGEWVNMPVGIFIEYSIIFQVILNISKDIRPMEMEEEIRYRARSSIAVIKIE